MNKLPQAMIIVDPKKEINAIREARKLNIPVFGIVDTNCDPDDVDYVIPGNDDAVRSVKLVLGVLNNAICEAKNLEMLDFVSEDDKKGAKETTTKKEEVEVKEEVKEETTTEEAQNLSALSIAQLKAMAREKGIKGYSAMKKAELIENLK